MIVDELVRANRRVLKLVSGAHFVQVPLDLCPLVETGPTVGTLIWTDWATKRALVPVGPTGHIRLDWCRPCHRALALFRVGEPGCVLLNEIPTTHLEPGDSWGVRVTVLALLPAHEARAAACVFAFSLIARSQDGYLCAFVIENTDAAQRMNDWLGNGFRWHARSGGSPEDSPEECTRRIAAALALTNSRNIKQEAVEPKRQAVRRASRAGHHPPFRYHVLNLVRRGTPRQGHRPTTTAEPIALHWTRGHFKDYSERGLFGKRRGVYWWSPHLAGRAPRVVAKDYRINTEELRDVTTDDTDDRP